MFNEKNQKTGQNNKFSKAFYTKMFTITNE
jgi:hypothetical protein